MAPDSMTESVQIWFSWPDRVILALVSALAGVIFAYVSSSIQRKKDAKTEAIKSISKEFLHQLDVIDSLVKDYWSVARSDMENGKEMALSSSIFIAFPRLQGTLDVLFRLKQENRSLQKNFLQRNIEEIYEYATARIDVEPRDVSQLTIMKTSRAILRLRLQFQEFIYR